MGFDLKILADLISDFFFTSNHKDIFSLYFTAINTTAQCIITHLDYVEVSCEVSYSIINNPMRAQE